MENGTTHDFEVTDAPKHGRRLDQFLVSRIPELSRSRIQALIKNHEVRLNGNIPKAGEIVKNADRVTLTIPVPKSAIPARAEEMPLEILYEDDDLLVLNKAAGIVVHPGAGEATRTLVNGLLHHCGSLSVIGGEERPGIVHRLDKETSGCLVVAKNDAAHQALSAQFASREVTKIYLAVVTGRPIPASGVIEAPIGRHRFHRKKMAVVQEPKGKPSVTAYRTLHSEKGISLVECRPATGRTHQIRVHLKHIGHSVVGDPLYGSRGDFQRHMLHAWKLSFQHPRRKILLQFEAPVPVEFPLQNPL
jgi:23S rRNA pseudouridine1911/1915/1917 synthase